MNIARWEGAVREAVRLDLPLYGMGSMHEAGHLRRELRSVCRRLKLPKYADSRIDDRSDHTAGNVANALRLGRAVWKFPAVTPELIANPSELIFVSHDFHVDRIAYLGDHLQRCLGYKNRRWAETVPFKVRVAAVSSEGLDRRFLAKYRDAEPAKLAADERRLQDWYRGRLHHAPTMLMRVLDDTEFGDEEEIDTEAALGRLLSAV
jgi:hypothetical protein